MKRKILVPMFASVMALSVNSIVNADEIENKTVESNEENTATTLELGEYEEVTYKVAAVKEGVAVKIREQGSVQHIAYSGDEFKVIATQGEWIKISVADGEGWIAARYVDITEARGYITADKVNLRKEANVEAEVVEELELGSSIKVVEDQGNWLKVKKGEEEGYIRALYVADEAPVIEVEEEVVAPEANGNTTSNSTSNNSNNSTSNNNSSNNSNSSNSSSSNKQPAQENNNSSNESYNPPASSNQSSAQAVLNLAYSKIGSPYVWGAEGPNSFDCSGFTSYVFKNAAGVSLPRTSSAQSGYGQTVSKSDLQPGDLVFFNTSGSGVSHVGIYVGGGNMIHSPSSGKTVSTTSINSSYYSSRFVTAKRVL
ncbi:MAG: NlpC/P60 family protein [Peptostreptococcaceae bacterium]